MGISVFKATGKAKCKKCHEVIEKDTISINFTAYRVSDQYHLECIKRLVEAIENDKRL
jgi:hypothetical protein